jgi:extracellular matrix protein 14
MVDREKMELSKRNIYLPGIKSLEDDFFNNFRNLEEIKKWMEDKVQRYPDLVSIEDIGNSYEKRPVLALRIEGNRGTPKPAVVFNGYVFCC